MCLSRRKAASGIWDSRKQEDEQNTEHKAGVGGRCRGRGSAGKWLRHSKGHGSDWVSVLALLHLFASLIEPPQVSAISSNSTPLTERTHLKSTEQPLPQSEWLAVMNGAGLGKAA